MKGGGKIQIIDFLRKHFSEDQDPLFFKKKCTYYLVFYEQNLISSTRIVVNKAGRIKEGCKITKPSKLSSFTRMVN